MTAPAGPVSRRWLAAPLWLRILALVAGALIAAQAVTLALTLVFPPQPPQQHSLPDIAHALGGSGGKPDLIRSRAEAPPSLQSPGWVTSPRLTGELAVLLDVPASDVRLLFYAPPPLAGFGPPPPPRPLAILDGEAALRAVVEGAVGGPAQAQPVTGAAPAMTQAGRVGLTPGGAVQGGMGYGSVQSGGFPVMRPVMGMALGMGMAPAGVRQAQDPRFGFERAGQRGDAAQIGTPAGLRGRPTASGRPLGVYGASAPGATPSRQGAAATAIGPSGLQPAQASIFREAAPYVTRGGPPTVSRIGGQSVSSLRPAGAIAATGPATAPPTWAVAGWAPARPPPMIPLAMPQSARRTAPEARAVAETSSAQTSNATRLAGTTAAVAAPPTAIEARETPRVALDAPAAPTLAIAPVAETRADPAAPEVTLAAPERSGMFGLTRASLIEGEFVAALRDASGGWTVVRPRPEGFPNSWQRRVFLWFGLSFALIAPVALLVAWRMTAPLQRFAEAAERLGREPTADMRPLDGPAEIGRAAAAFNLMQLRLKRYVEDRTGMVAAISHDLRTPLARMRFKLERAPPALRASMSRDMDHMEAMITSVLNFMHHDAAAGRRESVDLRSVLEVVVDDAGPRAELEPGPPVIVEADLIAIQRVFENLVDNALKYGEHARVSLRTNGGEAFVDVTDDGPGVAEEEFETVFKPFYRSAAAKASGSSGVGLGLPVSRSAVRAHGGDLVLRPAETGLTAEVRLPLSPARAPAASAAERAA